MNRLFKPDLLISFLLVVAAFVLGWLINGLREYPLSFRYQSVEVRMNELISQIAGEYIEKDIAIPSIDTPSLKRIYKEEGGLVIDARYSDDYNLSHIPGSVSLPRYSFGEEFERLRPTLKKNSDGQIIVYCLNNPCQDSLHVARALVHLGYQNVFHYPGGSEDWQDAGLPTEGAPNSTSQ